MTTKRQVSGGVMLACLALCGVLASGCSMIGGFIGGRVAAAAVAPLVHPVARKTIEVVGKEVGKLAGEAVEERLQGRPSAEPFQSVAPADLGRAPTHEHVAEGCDVAPTMTAACSKSDPRVRRVQVRLSGPASGTSPFHVAFRTNLTTEQVDGADFLWTLDGVPIDNAPNGAKILHAPATHQLAVLVITRDGQELRGATELVVRPLQ